MLELKDDDVEALVQILTEMWKDPPSWKTLDDARLTVRLRAENLYQFLLRICDPDGEGGDLRPASGELVPPMEVVEEDQPSCPSCT